MNKALRILQKVGEVSSVAAPLAFPASAPALVGVQTALKALKQTRASSKQIILLSIVTAVCSIEDAMGQEIVDEEKFAAGLATILDSLRGLK